MQKYFYFYNHYRKLIDIGLFMAFHKAFLEQCILKCFLTLILVGGHNECLDLCGSLSACLWKLLLVFWFPACGIKFFHVLKWSGHECVALDYIMFKVTWKSCLAISVLMLKSVIAYLHGHVRMLIALLVIFPQFEFIVLWVTHFDTHGVWFCLTVSKFCF